MEVPCYHNLLEFACSTNLKPVFFIQQVEPKEAKAFKLFKDMKPQTSEGKIVYPCPECEVTYNVQSSLVRHYKSAHIGMTYSCPVCFKTFSYQSSMTRHLHTHSTGGY